MFIHITHCTVTHWDLQLHLNLIESYETVSAWNCRCEFACMAKSGISAPWTGAHVPFQMKINILTVNINVKHEYGKTVNRSHEYFILSASSL